MTSFALSPRLDLASAQDLAAALRARAGVDLVIDAGGVTHLGALGLQILASAALSWRASGQSLRIAPRSEPFDAALASFGLPLSVLESEPSS